MSIQGIYMQTLRFQFQFQISSFFPFSGLNLNLLHRPQIE